jgi:hypothetical protein
MFPEDNGQSGPIYRKPEASTTESLELGHDCETNSKSDGMDFRRPLPIRPGLRIQAGGSQKAKLCTLDIQELEVVRRLDLGASKTYLQVTPCQAQLIKGSVHYSQGRFSLRWSNRAEEGWKSLCFYALQRPQVHLSGNTCIRRFWVTPPQTAC